MCLLSSLSPITCNSKIEGLTLVLLLAQTPMYSRTKRWLGASGPSARGTWMSIPALLFTNCLSTGNLRERQFPHLKKMFDIHSKSEGVISTEGLEVKCALCPKMHGTGS